MAKLWDRRLFPVVLVTSSYERMRERWANGAFLFFFLKYNYMTTEPRSFILIRRTYSVKYTHVHTHAHILMHTMLGLCVCDSPCVYGLFWLVFVFLSGLESCSMDILMAFLNGSMNGVIFWRIIWSNWWCEIYRFSAHNFHLSCYERILCFLHVIGQCDAQC